MFDEPTGDIQVHLTVPATKVVAASMVITEQYKTIVSDALKEIKTELLYDKDFQEQIKASVKTRIRAILAQRLEEAVKATVDREFCVKYLDIEKKVREVLLETPSVP